MEQKKNLKRKLERSNEILIEDENMVNPMKKRKLSTTKNIKKEKENQIQKSTKILLTSKECETPRKNSTNIRKKEKTRKSTDDNEVTFVNSANLNLKQKSKSITKSISKTKRKSKTQSKIISKRKKQKTDPEPQLKTIQNLNKNYSGCCKLNVLILDVQIFVNRISVILKDYGNNKIKFIAFGQNMDMLRTLKPGNFYQIKCPKIKSNPEKYSVYNKFILRIGPLTKISPLAKNSIGKLNLSTDKGWEFKDLRHAMKLNAKQRVDIIAIIGYVSKIIKFGNDSSSRRDFEIYDNSGMMSYMTLWSPHSEQYFEKNQIIALSQIQLMSKGGVLSRPGFIDVEPNIPQKIKLESWLQNQTELEFENCKQNYLKTITRSFKDIYRIQNIFKQNPKKNLTFILVISKMLLLHK